MTRSIPLAAVLLLAAGSALAQSQPMTAMPGMQQSAAGDASPSTQAYRDALRKMHHDMDIPFTGNADQDFVAGMIPHHQGAIDMAKTELRYGKDPALRRLAQDIVRAQEKEIGFMRQWQAKHASK
jgi:uncharacterized protein (DUF305 family)